MPMYEISIKVSKYGVQRDLRLLITWKYWKGGVLLVRAWKLSTTSPTPCPMHLFYLYVHVCPLSYPFIINWQMCILEFLANYQTKGGGSWVPHIMAGWFEVQITTRGWRLASILDRDSFVGQSP